MRIALDAMGGDRAPQVVVAGAALRCIRDERLYLAAGWGDFGSYCQEKWEMHRETVDRMLRCAEVARVLEEAGKKPENHLINRLTEDYVQTIVDHELPNDTD